LIKAKKQKLITTLNQKNRLFLIPYFSKLKNERDYEEFIEKVIDTLLKYSKIYGDSLELIAEIYNNYYMEYLELQSDFIKKGQYKYNDFNTLNQNLSSDFHKNYIYILLLSFMTTTYRFDMIKFISRSMGNLLEDNSEIGLEIGFGTGVDLDDNLKFFKQYEVYDLNPHSEMIFNLCFKEKEKINFHKQFYQFKEHNSYTYIQFIELLEHIEYPELYVNKAHDVLKFGGILIFTAAVNMANIDHIYLFNSKKAVKDLINIDKWKIIAEEYFINSLLKYPKEKINAIIENNSSPYIVTYVLKKI